VVVVVVLVFFFCRCSTSSSFYSFFRRHFSDSDSLGWSDRLRQDGGTRAGREA
jgi:hypothetical protein